MSRLRQYQGIPEGEQWDHVGNVLVDGHPLNPRFDLANHSPTGFAWGYLGSGPAQLALAILADHTRDSEIALNNYQAFKFDVVAKLNRGRWILTSTEIEAWLEGKANEQSARTGS